MADLDAGTPVYDLEPGSGRPPRMAFVVAALAVLALIVATALLLRRDLTPPDAPETAVWPWETSSTRFQTPVDAARSFATDFLGMTDPVVGPFAQGDTRSGEIEIRPLASGPVTTVFVRQGADDSWFVIGAANADIVLDEPEVLDELRSPVRLRGTALAFEGTVQVQVREDGRREPIGEGFVTGGGDEPRPFDEVIGFSKPRARAGALVLFTRSADDGRVWQASALRVRFAGAAG